MKTSRKVGRFDFTIVRVLTELELLLFFVPHWKPLVSGFVARIGNSAVDTNEVRVEIHPNGWPKESCICLCFEQWGSWVVTSGRVNAPHLSFDDHPLVFRFEISDNGAGMKITIKEGNARFKEEVEQRYLSSAARRESTYIGRQTSRLQ